MDGIALLTIFVLAVFVGFEVVSKVSTTLHTPLMSGANAIHGVILVGSIIVTGQTDSTEGLVLGLLSVVLATVNMVGGFVVTDRMLQMFRGRGQRPVSGPGTAPGSGAGPAPGEEGAR
jgi:NAD(P) transhydrogenase subunit alpha